MLPRSGLRFVFEGHMHPKPETSGDQTFLNFKAVLEKMQLTKYNLQRLWSQQTVLQ